VGLEEPVANRAKHREADVEEIQFLGGGGKRCSRLLGHCGGLAPEAGPEYPL